MSAEDTDPRFDESADDYTAVVGAQDWAKGSRLFARGAVQRLEHDPKHPWSYTASVQDRNETYTVSLIHDGDGWGGECDCRSFYDCQHCAAAFLAVRTLPRKATPRQLAEVLPRGLKAAFSILQPRTTFASSPLSLALEEAHGRRLKPEEVSFVTAIRRLWEVAGQGQITRWNLTDIVRLPGNSWEPVDLCPAKPRDDLECWQFVARIFREHKLPIPPFMAPVTNIDRIEELIRTWERQKEIARWRARVQSAGTTPPEHMKPPLQAELRLRFGPEQADIEWRSAGNDAFNKCRQKDLEAIREAHEVQTLVCTPTTERLLLMLQSSFFTSALNYQEYSRLLARILDTPEIEPLTVGKSGSALIRVAERLRLECLRPDGSEDYRLRFVLPDGTVPPRFQAIIRGTRDCYYLTDETVYRGPQHHELGDEPEIRVPAAAMESVEGYRFFVTKGLPVPPSLNEKVQVVRMIPAISCSIQERPGFRPCRELRVSLTAGAPNGPKLQFKSWQWSETRRTSATQDTLAKPDDKIRVLDNTLMTWVVASIERLDLKWDQGLGVMFRRWPKSYPDWLVNWLRSLPPEVTLDLDPEIKSLLSDPVTVRMRIEMQETEIDWFDVKVVMDVSETTLTPEELALLLKATGQAVFLPRLGEWKRIKTDWTDEDNRNMARIGLSPADINGEPHRVHALQLADGAAAKLLPPEHVEKIQRRIEELKTRVTPPMPPLITAELRPYQMDGFHFLAYLAENRFGGVLADDMGLGKTLQALCWLAWLRIVKAPTDGIPPSLVVCPKSVVENWKSEAERFYPSLRVIVWAPAAGVDFAQTRRDADLIVMNYTQLRLLEPAAMSTPWFVAILDEAQGIKNPNSQTAQAARSIVATHRLALTGTPIENRLMDLWSIMAFAMPGALGNRTLFARRFASQEDPLARGRLAARVRPFLIRRTKEEVAKDLPDRIEEDMICEMEGHQLTLYQAELKRAQQLLLGVQSQAEFNRERFNFLTSLLRLRQICCHTALVEKQTSGHSSKLDALIELIEPLMKEGHKVLVFSQFVQMLALIEKRIIDLKWPWFMLTGDTEDRGALVRNFQEHEGGAVFLLSLKAGGFGLNLTAANYVVLYDPWWNPAVERQAIDRTHRIGQVNPVNAYRLIAKNSIEQKIRLLQQRKSALAESVLGDERFGEALSLDDLKFILQD